MTDEVDGSETKRIEYRLDVSYERVEIGGRWCASRRAEAATGNADDVKAVGKLRGEFIEDVGRTSETGEEHERLAPTAPIQHLERYGGGNSRHSDRGRG